MAKTNAKSTEKLFQADNAASASDKSNLSDASDIRQYLLADLSDLMEVESVEDVASKAREFSRVIGGGDPEWTPAKGWTGDPVKQWVTEQYDLPDDEEPLEWLYFDFASKVLEAAQIAEGDDAVPEDWQYIVNGAVDEVATVVVGLPRPVEEMPDA